MHPNSHHVAPSGASPVDKGFPQQPQRRRAIAAAVLLALALVGLPLTGVLFMGHRLRDYLEFPPLTRYVTHAPFSWWVFAGLALFTLLALFPFIRSFLCAQPPPPAARDPRPVVFRLLFGDPMPVGSRMRFPGWGWLALAVLGVAWLLAWTRFAWFAPLQRHTFIPLWLACIGILNALTQQRIGSCLLTRRPRFFIVLFPASAVFWWFFEYLNRFSQNWYYRDVEDLSGGHYAVLAASVSPPCCRQSCRWLNGSPRFHGCNGASTSPEWPVRPILTPQPAEALPRGVCCCLPESAWRYWAFTRMRSSLFSGSHHWP